MPEFFYSDTDVEELEKKGSYFIPDAPSGTRIWPTGPTFGEVGTGAMSLLDSLASATRTPFDYLSNKSVEAMGIPLRKDDPRRNALGLIPSNELLRIDDPKARSEDLLLKNIARSMPGAAPAAGALRLAGKEDLARLVEDLARKPAELGLGMGTDPGMVLGVGEGVAALKGAAPLVAGANRALGGVGALTGSVGALRSGGQTLENLRQGKYGDALLSGVDTGTQAIMAGLGAVGARGRRSPVADPDVPTAVDTPSVVPAEPVAIDRATPEWVAAREKAASEYQAPPLLKIPVDDVPGPLRGDAEKIASGFAGELAKTGRTIDDAALDAALTPDLQPFREQIRTQAILEGSSLIQGQDMIQSLRDNHGAVAPPKSGSGIKVIESGQPGGLDVLQFHNREIVGGAQVSGNTLNMVGGGRRMGSPASISPVYAMLDKLSVKRNDALTLLGKKSRRSHEINRLTDESLRGKNVAEPSAVRSQAGVETPEPTIGPAAAEGSGVPRAPVETAAPEAPDVTDPYIYTALDPTKPHTSARNLMRTIVRPARPILTNIEKMAADGGSAEVGNKLAENGRIQQEMWERTGASWDEQAARLNNDIERAGFKWDDIDKWRKGEAVKGSNRRVPVVVPAKAQPLLDRFAALHDHVGKKAVESGAMDQSDWVKDAYPERPLDKDFFTTAAQAKRIKAGGPIAVRTAAPYIGDDAVLRQKVADGKLSIEEASALVQSKRDVRRSATTPFNASLEAHRSGGMDAGTYDTSYLGYRQYLVDAAGRIADARVWGPKGEKFDTLVRQVPDAAHKAYITTHMDRLRRVSSDENRFAESLSGNVRGATAASSLGLGFVSQIGQVVLPMAHAGVLKTVGHSMRALTGGRGVRGLAKVGDNIREAKLTASEARFPNITTEYAEGVGLKGFFGKAPWLKWLSHTDDLVRTISDPIGKDFIPMLVERAKKGDKHAGPYLKEIFHIDYKKFDPKGKTADGTPHMTIAGKAFSDAMNLRTRTGDVPGWTTHPLGKAAFQFSNYVFQATRHAGNVLYLATVKRNPYAIKAAARGLAAAAIIGNGLGATKSMLKGQGLMAEDPGDWERALKQVAKGRRIPLTGGAAREAPVKNTILWAAQGVMMAGVLGYAENMLRQFALGAGGTKKNAWERAGNLIGGPSAEKVIDIVGKPAIAAVQGEGKKAGMELLTGLTRSAPFVGREAAREMSSEQLPDNPGWVGRTRDVIQGEQDPMDALLGGVFGEGSIPGRNIRGGPHKAERRVESEQRKASAEELRALTQERLAEFPRETRTQAQKDTAQERRLAKEEFRLPLMRAIRDGDKEAADELLRTAARAGVPFTRREIIELNRRLK